jgi:hypothetical protein
MTEPGPAGTEGKSQRQIGGVLGVDESKFGATWAARVFQEDLAI